MQELKEKKSTVQILKSFQDELREFDKQDDLLSSTKFFHLINKLYEIISNPEIFKIPNHRNDLITANDIIRFTKLKIYEGDNFINAIGLGEEISRYAKVCTLDDWPKSLYELIEFLINNLEEQQNALTNSTVLKEVKKSNKKKELSKDELLNQVKLKPCLKRVLEYALDYKKFYIGDLASWYYKTEEFTPKQEKLMGKYFSNINKELNSVLSTKDKKYIWQNKENIDDLDNRKKNSGVCIVEIPLK